MSETSWMEVILSDLLNQKKDRVLDETALMAVSESFRSGGIKEKEKAELLLLEETELFFAEMINRENLSYTDVRSGKSYPLRYSVYEQFPSPKNREDTEDIDAMLSFPAICLAGLVGEIFTDTEENEKIGSLSDLNRILKSRIKNAKAFLFSCAGRNLSPIRKRNSLASENGKGKFVLLSDFSVRETKALIFAGRYGDDHLKNDALVMMIDGCTPVIINEVARWNKMTGMALQYRRATNVNLADDRQSQMLFSVVSELCYRILCDYEPTKMSALSSYASLCLNRRFYDAFSFAKTKEEAPLAARPKTNKDEAKPVLLNQLYKAGRTLNESEIYSGRVKMSDAVALLNLDADTYYDHITVNAAYKAVSDAAHETISYDALDSPDSYIGTTKESISDMEEAFSEGTALWKAAKDAEESLCGNDVYMCRVLIGLFKHSLLTDAEVKNRRALFLSAGTAFISEYPDISLDICHKAAVKEPEKKLKEPETVMDIVETVPAFRQMFSFAMAALMDYLSPFIGIKPDEPVVFCQAEVESAGFDIQETNEEDISFFIES